MKFIKIIVLIFILLNFLNCSNEESKVENESLPGTWKISSFTHEKEYDFNEDAVFSNDHLLETNNCGINAIIIFNDDKTGEYKNTSYATILTVNGDESAFLNLNCFQTNDFRPFTWSQQNDKITLLFENNFEWSLTLKEDELIYVSPFIFIAEFFYGEGTRDTTTIIYAKE